MMLQAREEGEALLKAEVQRLAEENSRLQEESLEHRGEVMGLQEKIQDMEQAVDAAAATQVLLLQGGGVGEGGGLASGRDWVSCGMQLCSFLKKSPDIWPVVSRSCCGMPSFLRWVSECIMVPFPCRTPPYEVPGSFCLLAGAMTLH